MLESDEEEFVDLPFLEGDEEKYNSPSYAASSKGVKEGKGLKNLTPTKLITRLLALLAQIEGRDNSINYKGKLKDYFVCISILRSPKKFATI